MDNSLRKFMTINRGMFFKSSFLNIPIIVYPIVVLPMNPIISSYNVSDFGENVINSHYDIHISHSERTQLIFNYITKNFRDRCTSIQSYNSAILNNTAVYNPLESCKLVKADLVYMPYVDAAKSLDTNNDNLILTVGSHYDNDGQGVHIVGEDNNRHDITADANTFLIDSIAVSCRRDTPEEFKNSTSEGFGMEFFEDGSPEALDPFYPDRDVDTAFAELVSSDGVNLTSNVHLQFTTYLFVGEVITIRLPGNTVTTTITEIVNGNHIRVSPSIAPITVSNIYGWHLVTFGTYVGGQAESWATPIVAGKLKVIKMSTGANWDTVRAAARATAKRNPTGIPEIDNTNWDIYRGFGCIQIQEAINYININN